MYMYIHVYIYMYVYIYIYMIFRRQLTFSKGFSKIRRLSSPGESQSFTTSWGPLCSLAGLVSIYNGLTIYGYAIYMILYQVISYIYRV